MCKNSRTRNATSNSVGSLFGVWSRFGFKPIMSLLVVFSLALLPLHAIPGKAGLFQRAALTSQSNSQSQSSENSVALNNSQEIQSPMLEENLLKAKDSLTNASAKLDVADSQIASQTALTEILRQSQALTLKVNDNLVSENEVLTKDNAKKDGIIETLKGNKVQKIFDVGGTYNTIDGWGLSADVGLKKGIFTTKFGAEALVGDLINPNALRKLDTYTFRASVGLQW